MMMLKDGTGRLDEFKRFDLAVELPIPSRHLIFTEELP